MTSHLKCPHDGSETHSVTLEPSGNRLKVECGTCNASLSVELPESSFDALYDQASAWR